MLCHVFWSQEYKIVCFIYTTQLISSKGHSYQVISQKIRTLLVSFHLHGVSLTSKQFSEAAIPSFVLLLLHRYILIIQPLISEAALNLPRTLISVNK